MSTNILTSLSSETTNSSETKSPGNRYHIGITVARHQKIQNLVAKRQEDLVLLLENVWDPHNIGAVLRTCDAVGIADVYILYTDDRIDEDWFNEAKRTAKGSEKWVRTHYFEDLKKCVQAIRQKVNLLIGTHLSSGAKSLYELNLTQPVALVFGNESEGITDELLSQLDMNMFIPQIGMVQSLNISVACAISLYECYRQRETKIKEQSFDMDNLYQKGLFKYYEAHHRKEREEK